VFHATSRLSEEGEAYGTRLKSIFYLKKGRISWQKAGPEGALHMQAMKALETLHEKYLLVEIGDIDRLCATNVDWGRSDPRDVLAVVIETEFSQLSERARIN
jgi:hypothetical protein